MTEKIKRTRQDQSIESFLKIKDKLQSFQCSITISDLKQAIVEELRKNPYFDEMTNYIEKEKILYLSSFIYGLPVKTKLEVNIYDKDDDRVVDDRNEKTYDVKIAFQNLFKSWTNKNIEKNPETKKIIYRMPTYIKGHANWRQTNIYAPQPNNPFFSLLKLISKINIEMFNESESSKAMIKERYFELNPDKILVIPTRPIPSSNTNIKHKKSQKPETKRRFNKMNSQKRNQKQLLKRLELQNKLFEAVLAEEKGKEIDPNQTTMFSNPAFAQVFVAAEMKKRQR